MQPYHPTIVVTRDESDPWLVTLMQITHLDTDGWWVPITFGYVALPINGTTTNATIATGEADLNVTVATTPGNEANYTVTESPQVNVTSMLPMSPDRGPTQTR